MKSMSHSTPSDARKDDAPRNAASLPHVNAVTSGREHADAQRAEHDHATPAQRAQGARDAPAAALVDDHDARGIGRAHEHDPEPAHMHGIGRRCAKVAHVAEEERRRAEGEEMLLQRAQQTDRPDSRTAGRRPPKATACWQKRGTSARRPASARPSSACADRHHRASS